MPEKYVVRYATHPQDVGRFTTERIRREFLIESLFETDTCNLVYSHFDRMIIGGVLPVTRVELHSLPIQKTAYFTERRELGVINIGGKGTISIDGEKFTLNNLDALYTGRGKKKISFESVSSNKPAKFYLNSALAQRDTSTLIIRKEEVHIQRLGDQEHANKRELHQYIVPALVDSCQLMMGVTHCLDGNVWNTMPCHTHELRMEAYLYFDIESDEQVCHIMGTPNETRNIWVQNEQVVISPPWSIHTAAGTKNYKFIWGMAGSDSEMDFVDKQMLK